VGQAVRLGEVDDSGALDRHDAGESGLVSNTVEERFQRGPL
jgi:hypothetical protein